LGYLPAAREDLAVGMAAGAYLAGKNPCVLMQNSGLGYSLNAFTSLNLIFKIPVLLIIGYRGAGPDAPEHWVMGRSCTKVLEAVAIPYWVPEKETLIPNTRSAIETMKKEKVPVALLIQTGIFLN
jgi:sulfopyruvate decarboxylase alpha subunit